MQLLYFPYRDFKPQYIQHQLLLKFRRYLFTKLTIVSLAILYNNYFKFYFIFTVLDAEDETTIIGYLTVSVTALQVLISLSSQLH